jgi:hypothetical protein
LLDGQSGRPYDRYETIEGRTAKREFGRTGMSRQAEILNGRWDARKESHPRTDGWIGQGQSRGLRLLRRRAPRNDIRAGRRVIGVLPGAGGEQPVRPSRPATRMRFPARWAGSLALWGHRRRGGLGTYGGATDSTSSAAVGRKALNSGWAIVQNKANLPGAGSMLTSVRQKVCRTKRPNMVPSKQSQFASAGSVPVRAALHTGRGRRVEDRGAASPSPQPCLLSARTPDGVTTNGNACRTKPISLGPDCR